ncbi:uncharacterized protein LAJ45_05817 [Morchella importuna]|uniref:uncharacterized protein n=1 Tax=Morchella importuna TaxID=1174673 RepID=UPI001E8CD9A3|nr:uncharacterized protein LAJ45_05817 [Morchella importuna]KAH8150131.1 hypothetical protein LAJ45_05817 [Morchella importuna]
MRIDETCRVECSSKISRLEDKPPQDLSIAGSTAAAGTHLRHYVSITAAEASPLVSSLKIYQRQDATRLKARPTPN